MRTARAIAALLAIAYLMVGPALVELAHVDVPALPRWRMFTRAGIGVCTAVYTVGGEPIDRWELRQMSRWEASRRDRALHDLDRVVMEGRALCRIEGIDNLHVEASCGTVKGWLPLLEGKENLCKVRRPRAREGYPAKAPYRRKR